MKICRRKDGRKEKEGDYGEDMALSGHLSKLVINANKSSIVKETQTIHLLQRSGGDTCTTMREQRS